VEPADPAHQRAAALRGAPVPHPQRNLDAYVHFRHPDLGRRLYGAAHSVCLRHQTSLTSRKARPRFQEPGPAFTIANARSAALTAGDPSFGKLTGSQPVGRQIQFGLKFLW
jgi:hypothetical protein